MKAPRCPRCRRPYARRGPRVGLLDHLLSRAYLYPFRCQVCNHRFRAVQWGVRYERHAEERREHDRAAIRLPVSITYHQMRGSGELVEISVAGGTVETDLPLPAGALVQLEMKTSHGTIAIDGGLVRSVGAGRVGLQFAWVRADQKGPLRELTLRALGYDERPTSEARVAVRRIARARRSGVWVLLLVVLGLCALFLLVVPQVGFCRWAVNC